MRCSITCEVIAARRRLPRCSLTNLISEGAHIMAPHRILRFNALANAGCAIGMLATRATLYTSFGLRTPVLLDVLAVGLLGYAGLLWPATRRLISRQSLLTFTAAVALCVVASALVLVFFWGQFDAVARLLIIAVAIVVEVLDSLQYLAARKPRLEAVLHVGS
jgi:hypothetical protein